MNVACAVVAFELLASSLFAAGSASPSPAPAACPVSFESVTKDSTKPPIRFSLLGAEGLSHLEIGKPSESGFFVVANEGAARESARVEFQVEARRETMQIPIAELPASLAWSSAATSSSKLVGTVSPGTYRLVLIYVSPESPSPGKAQRLCMAMSEAFDLTEAFTVHRFE